MHIQIIAFNYEESISYNCFALTYIYTRYIQYFCQFAFVARSTTVIFVECITFHQSSLLDDVHKDLAFFHWP